MGGDNFRDTLPDPDPEQTLEWQEAIRAVSDALGPERAHRLLLQTIAAAREEGVEMDVVNTPYPQYNPPLKSTIIPWGFGNGVATSWNNYLECNDDGNKSQQSQ